MKISFDITCDIKIYEFIGEVGYEEDKPEYLVYLKAINEAGGNVVDYLHTNLLNKFPVSTVNNLLSELKALLLIDNNYQLTDTGKEALNEEKIFVPTRGTYTIEVAENSPLKSSIIYIKTNRSYNGEECDVDKILSKEVNKKIELLDNQIIRIINFDKKGRVANKKNKFKINLIYENNVWSAFVNNKRKKVAISDEFLNLNLEDKILNNFERALGNPNAILVKTKDLSDSEILEFKGDKKLNNSIIKEYKLDNNIIVKDLELLPFDNQEAYLWAIKIFTLKYINDYATISELKYQWEQMILNYKQFELYDIPFPSIKDLKKHIDKKKNNMRFWFLQAPIDFRLEEI